VIYLPDFLKSDLIETKLVHCCLVV